MGGEACRAHAQKRPVNRQWRWVSGKMKWFHIYRLPSAKLEPEEKLLKGAVADVTWLVSPRLATQNRPVGYVFCCCFLFYTYSLTIPNIPIIAKSVGPIFDKFSWLDELVSYEPMTVDNQSEIGFFNPSQVCCHGNQILLVYMYCIICMSVTGRTRLLAQSGGLTLDFALHLGFISTCFNINLHALTPCLWMNDAVTVRMNWRVLINANNTHYWPVFTGSERNRWLIACFSWYFVYVYKRNVNVNRKFALPKSLL